MKQTIKRFRLNEAGHASLEFVIMFPILFIILLSSIELGMMTLRSAMLERALDVVVREIRLTTGTSPSHQTLKTMICDETSFVPDCQNTLALEMYILEPRNWNGIPQSAACTNRAEGVEDDENFQHIENGLDNELMVLRACVKLSPMFTNTGFSSYLTRDAAGDTKIVTMSAFVQEPR